MGRQAEATVDQDPARTAIESRVAARQTAEAERDGESVPTAPEIQRRQFAEDVRARMASGGQKGVGPTKKMLMPDRFHLAESRRRLYCVDALHGTTIEDVLDPKYWANVGPRLSQWDRIDVRAEDGSYLAELIVEDSGVRYAKVALLNYYELQVVDLDNSMIPPGYAIEWKGMHSKWVVLRGSDLLQEKFGNRFGALDWLRNHLGAMAR